MRTRYSIKNLLYSYGMQLVGILLNFINRRVFASILSEEYLGINGLFSSVLTLLSFAELGIGSAITFSLYKPIAENNYEEISALVNFYKKCYTVMGCVITGLGICLLPILPYFINNYSSYDAPLKLYFLIYLANTVISYFCAHKRSLIGAAQKMYVDTVNTYFFRALQYVFQIIILYITHNFVLYLVVQFITTVLSNLVLSRKVNKMLPEVNYKNPPSLKPKIKKEIYRNTFALFFHKMGTIIVNNTDNIIISSYISLELDGRYSNYVMLLASLNGICVLFSNSLWASVGNMNADSVDLDHKYNVFRMLDFVSFIIYGSCFTVLVNTMSKFIGRVWLGERFVLSADIVIIVLLDFWISGMRTNVQMFKNTAGLYWEDRFRPIAEIIINLILSIGLVNSIGLAGVVLGTIVSKWGIACWMEAKILYNKLFYKSVKEYFRYYLKQCIILVLAGGLSYLFCNRIHIGNNVGELVICAVISEVCFGLGALIFYGNSSEIKLAKQYLKKILGK